MAIIEHIEALTRALVTTPTPFCLVVERVVQVNGRWLPSLGIDPARRWRADVNAVIGGSERPSGLGDTPDDALVALRDTLIAAAREELTRACAQRAEELARVERSTGARINTLNDALTAVGEGA